MKKIEIKNLTFDYPLMEKAFKILKEKDFSDSNNIGGNIIFTKKIKYLRAICNLSLDINKGDKLAILGHNGSGKTTLLNILSGVYEVDGVKIFGNLQSFISPNAGMDLEANCIENLKLILRLRKSTHLINDKLIIEALTKNGLGDYIYFPVKFLSSGMKIRLSFTVLEYLEKDIILLDEWIAVVDKNFNLLNSENFLLNSKLTLVFATHSEKLAKKYCTKFIVLEKGSIINQGDIKDVSKEYFLKK